MVMVIDRWQLLLGRWPSVVLCLCLAFAVPGSHAPRAQTVFREAGNVIATDETRSLAVARDAGSSDPERWATLSTRVFRTYGQDDGLPNTVATAIAEDGDGFIWVGTQGGLARWDGYRFRTYKPVAGNAGALPDSWVTTLHTDPRGRLWIGTSAGGLATYDRDRDRFKSYRGLGSVNVRDIDDDGAGGLWVANDDGLNHLDPASGRIESFRHRPQDADSLPDDRVFAVLRDRSGTLWVGTGGGLARRMPGSDRFHPVPLGATPSAQTAVKSLFEDSQGSLWIGTTRAGAFVMRPARGESVWKATPVAVRAPGDDVSVLTQEWVFSIAQSGPEEIWLGTYGRGIVAVDMRTGHTHSVGHDVRVRQSLPNNAVFALHQDRTGAMWVGTDAGLSRLNASRSAPALTVFGGTSSAAGLTDPNVLALAALSDGRVWAGLQFKGIDIFEPRRGRVTSVTPDPSKASATLPASRVMSFAEWSDGTLYVGTTHGLYRTDLGGTTVTRLTVPGRDPTADTRRLLAADGRLWIAGNEDGIWTLVPEGGPASTVEHFDAGQLTDRRGTALAEGLAGDVWIGTRNGLNRIVLATREIERILPDRSNPTALQAGQVTGMVFDKAGRLWVGTMGGGIQVLIRRESGRPVFHRIGIAQGLPDDNVDGLLTDTAGRIWAATDNGIAVIDPDDFSIHALHRSEGVEIAAYWAGSAAATASGELLFGGAGGITVIRPDRFRPWDHRPKIVLTEAKIGDKPVEAGRFNGADAGVQEPLVVQPDTNSLTVEFAALDYSAPDRNRYAYSLEGFDRGWTETASSRRVAAYMNLPPGNYTLRLRGSNREGVWTDATLDIPVRVLPAWFQTLWFKLVLVFLVVAAGWALVQSRTIYLRRRQRELEKLVAERTFELEERKQQIEQIAYQDALTGLPNRRFFSEEMRSLTSRAARGQGFALLMIDLDRFKQINDTWGHDAGDALLVECATRIRASLRLSDRLVRLGGDEFAVLVADTPSLDAAVPDDVEAICARIVACFDSPVLFLGVELNTTASVGVAMCPAEGNTPEALYKAADLALYEAKRAGRNTWRGRAGAGAIGLGAALAVE